MSVVHGGNIFEVSRQRGWDWRTVADFSASASSLPLIIARKMQKTTAASASKM